MDFGSLVWGFYLDDNSSHAYGRYVREGPSCVGLKAQGRLSWWSCCESTWYRHACPRPRTCQRWGKNDMARCIIIVVMTWVVPWVVPWVATEEQGKGAVSVTSASIRRPSLWDQNLAWSVAFSKSFIVLSELAYQSLQRWCMLSSVEGQIKSIGLSLRGRPGHRPPKVLPVSPCNLFRVSSKNHNSGRRPSPAPTLELLDAPPET